MLIQSIEKLNAELKALENSAVTFKRTPQKTRLLMVSPDHYSVQYAINPHMLDSSGKLNTIDPARARLEWESLKRTFINLGCEVSVIQGAPGLPDMVFSANQCLPFKGANNDETPGILLSEMASPFRKKEVQFFETYFTKKQFKILRIPFAQNKMTFEGMGDALWAKGKRLLFGGYGFRTSLQAYIAISEALDCPVIPLKLNSEHFYHLDTCMSILSENTVAIHAEAFDKNSLSLIRGAFANVIEVSKEEAQQHFACNCYCPDEENVVLQKGSIEFNRKLVASGFNPIEVDTSEFIKGGGSVFCLKLEY